MIMKMWDNEIYLAIDGMAIRHTLIQEHKRGSALYLNETTDKPIRISYHDTFFETRIGALKFIRDIARDKVRYCNRELKLEEETVRGDADDV